MVPPMGTAILSSTVLGLPRWWCYISLILGILFIGFMIIAYIKGRSMLKARERETGIRSLSCSNCGRMIKEYTSDCPACGVSFGEDLYICPNCSGGVGLDDTVCSHCNARMRKVVPVKARSGKGSGKDKIRDKDLEKLKGPIKQTQRYECPECGAFKEGADTDCPFCDRTRGRWAFNLR